MMETGGVREIQLTRGYVTLVDEADFEWLNAWKWFAGHAGRGYVYALRAVNRQPQARMHRLIAEAVDGQQVDHINGNTLDNRRANLRTCSAAENDRNRRRRSDNTSGYKGVHAFRGRWRALICVDGRRVCLGVHDDLIAAARAYDEAAVRLHGEFARLNFPKAA